MSTCESAEDTLLKANIEFLDKNYKSALEQYNLSVQLDDTISDTFVKRSLCLEKLKRFSEAAEDTNKAISLDPMSFKAYYQKGVICYELGNVQEAREAFQKCQALDRNDSFIPAWLEKCKTTSSTPAKQPAPKPAAAPAPKPEAPKPTPPSSTSSSSSAPSTAAPQQPARPPAPMAPKAPRAPKVSAQPAPKPTPAPAPTPTPNPEPASAPAPHVPPPVQRYNWFQNDNFVVVTVFVKGAKPENVAIDFETQNLSVSVQLSTDNQFLLDLDLAHEIDPAQSKYEIMSTKIEIKLKKAQPVKWDTIERKEEAAAPPAKKQNKNWDKILAGEEEDKDTGFNQLMRDMYSGASEEERRAMMKSFHESGGTVLSCDWKDVSKGHVEPKPPVGVTRWEKDAV